MKKSEYPRLDMLAKEIAKTAAVLISVRLSDDGARSDHRYADQYVLEQVIRDLQARV